MPKGLENNAEIGERVRRARLVKGYKQDFVAEYCGVNSKHISMIENGDSGISVAVLKGICEVLDVSADYILFGHQRAASQLDTLLLGFTPEQMDDFLEISRLIAHIRELEK